MRSGTYTGGTNSQCRSAYEWALYDVTGVNAVVQGFEDMWYPYHVSISNMRVHGHMPTMFRLGFDPNGGSGEMDETLFAPVYDNSRQQPFLMPECTFTAPENKEFSHWEIDGETYAAGDELELHRHVAAKAVWKDKKTTAYPLWLGETQVTADNKGDILGDGRAKYDPETGTLLLLDPVIEGKDPEHKAKIYADGIDLCVKGSYKMTDFEGKAGIQVDNGNLVLDGSFTFMGSLYGIFADPILKLDGGEIAGYATEGIGICAWNYIFITDAVTRVEASSDTWVAMYASKSIKVGDHGSQQSALRLLEPYGGTVSDKVYDGDKEAKKAVFVRKTGDEIKLVGDVNNDGVVDVNDATYVQMYAADMIEFSDEQKLAGDVNRDGVVDVNDATYIQMYAAELIESFAG